MQRSGGLPQRETCELLILDRSVDPVAPVIHEWTYEALVYDLLSPEDNVIRSVQGFGAVWAVGSLPGGCNCGWGCCACTLQREAEERCG